MIFLIAPEHFGRLLKYGKIYIWIAPKVGHSVQTLIQTLENV